MATYDPTTKTPAEWRAMARDERVQEGESFDRCDTDGCLTQAACRAMYHLYTLCADVAENNGRARFQVVTDLDGNILDATLVQSRYGWSWRIWNEGTRQVSWFSPSLARKGKTRIAKNEAKGYRVVWAEAKALVETAGWTGGRTIPAKGAEYTILGIDDQDFEF